MGWEDPDMKKQTRATMNVLLAIVSLGLLLAVMLFYIDEQIHTDSREPGLFEAIATKIYQPENNPSMNP
jgi:hypothetical protein